LPYRKTQFNEKHVETLLIHSDSTCPSESAVIAGVGDLTSPEQRAAAPRNASVVISDRGDRITVTISRDGETTLRDYRDAARDCDRRAHFAAVLTVVSLLPPASSDAAPAPVPVPTPAAAPPSAAAFSLPALPPPRERHVRIELGAVTSFSMPISDSVRALSPGLLLGVALGAGKLRLTLATKYAPPAEVDYTGAFAGRAELQRFDAGIGARRSLWRHGVDLAVELVALASHARMRSLTTRESRRDTAFSLGGRAGLHLSVAEPWPVSPFLGLSAEVFPRAPAVMQLPAGTVGHLPYGWLGVTVGLTLAL
jgi:hypothetical protein